MTDRDMDKTQQSIPGMASAERPILRQGPMQVQQVSSQSFPAPYPKPQAECSGLSFSMEDYRAQVERCQRHIREQGEMLRKVEAQRDTAEERELSALRTLGRIEGERDEAHARIRDLEARRAGSASPLSERVMREVVAAQEARLRIKAQWDGLKAAGIVRVQP